MEVLRLENVYKNYGKGEAIKDLSFSCEEGDLFIIIGPSGAGKTTTLKMIGGLEEIRKGKIFLKTQYEYKNDRTRFYLSNPTISFTLYLGYLFFIPYSGFQGEEHTILIKKR